MKVIFLDIDGVLNNCMSSGVFHQSSTSLEQIELLNQIITTTNSYIIIISTWKDVYNFEVIKNLLYERGVLRDSIAGLTPVSAQKEEGINIFLKEIEIESFVIIDDNLDLITEKLREKYVQPDSLVGLTQIETDLAIQKLQ